MNSLSGGVGTWDTGLMNVADAYAVRLVFTANCGTCGQPRTVKGRGCCPVCGDPVGLGNTIGPHDLGACGLWLSSCDAGSMFLSLVYRATRRVLGTATVLLRRDVFKDAELLVLRHENAVLRRQIPRVRYEPADRFWFAALSSLISRRRWAEVFPVSPATLLVWHRRLVARKWAYSARRKPGRPPTAAAVKKLVLTMAKDNPMWGHRRIQGELVKLGHQIAASTVWEILHAAGVDPAPRRLGPTWKQFLTAQAHGILAIDFVHGDTIGL